MRLCWPLLTISSATWNVLSKVVKVIASFRRCLFGETWAAQITNDYFFFMFHFVIFEIQTSHKLVVVASSSIRILSKHQIDLRWGIALLTLCDTMQPLPANAA